MTAHMNQDNSHSYAEVLFGTVERLLEVTTPKALAHWMESELRPIFPYGACVIALGRVAPDMSLSTICSSPAFPESLLRSFRVLTDGSATPLLQQWLALQKPIVVELNGDYQGMAPLWLTVLRQQNFKQAAMVAIDPRSGEIQAMVGGKDFSKNQFNRVTQAQRQPGSTFKGFVYATAIATGKSPYDSYLDEPLSIDGYEPKNSHNKFFAPLAIMSVL